MDCSLSALPPLSDKSDEPQTPPRSPSRLDFCMEDVADGGAVLEGRDNLEIYDMGWACTPFRGNYPYTFIREDATAVNVPPLDSFRHSIAENGLDDIPQPTYSQPYGNACASHTFPVQRGHSTDRAVIEPQSPIPVRPLLVQLQLDTVDAQEYRLSSRTASQRLNYPHHGLSRSALLQQKALWNSRHEEWAEWQSQMEQGEGRERNPETNDAYAGVAFPQPPVMDGPPPYTRTPPSGLERDLADDTPAKREQDTHASIFPRVGDISALRDPYSVNVDRCFFRFPLWTLQKMLYVFDMHQRCAPLAPSASVYNLEHIGASVSSSTLSSYTSSTSGDDGESDSTLVADDSSIPVSKLPLEPAKCVSSPRNPSSWNRFCGWELSWYARWELLIGLFQRDQTKCDALDMSMKPAVPDESKATPPSPPGPVFGFTAGEVKDNDGDDDEDYGMIVPDSSTFSVDFDEECERAMAFYSRESRRSEMVL